MRIQELLLLAAGGVVLARHWRQRERLRRGNGRRPGGGGRTKRLVLSLYGSSRDLGAFETCVHSELRSVVDGIKRKLRGRGKPIVLAPERMACVERALAGSEWGSVEGLGKAMQNWRNTAQWKAGENDKH